MPSYLDLGVLGVVLVSAILSLMRGFTREVWRSDRGWRRRRRLTISTRK